MVRASIALLMLAPLLAGCEIGTEAPPAATQRADTFANPASGHLPAAAPQIVKQPTVTSMGSPLQALARGQLRFVDGYQQGYQHALSAGKPMLVFFTAHWCRYCHQMADEAFNNQQVVALSDRFVCILVDADAEPEVCRQFRVQGYPTIQFLSARGVPLNRMVGKRPSQQLVTAMQAALQNVARRTTTRDDSVKQY